MNDRLRLREIRKSKGLTVAELARSTGLHPTTLFDLEAGRRHAYPKYRDLLEGALGEPASVLFGEAGGDSADEEQTSTAGEQHREASGNCASRTAV